MQSRDTSASTVAAVAVFFHLLYDIFNVLFYGEGADEGTT